MLQRECVVNLRQKKEQKKVTRGGKSEKTVLAWLAVSLAPLEACS